jgi:hypothetical protein
MVARSRRFGLGLVLTTSIVALAGAAFGWNGLVANLRAWHTSRQGLNGSPTDKLVVDGLVVRGDKSLFESPIENPAGVWLSNYAAKTIVVRTLTCKEHGRACRASGPASPVGSATQQLPKPRVSCLRYGDPHDRGEEERASYH